MTEKLAELHRTITQGFRKESGPLNGIGVLGFACHSFATGDSHSSFAM